MRSNLLARSLVGATAVLALAGVGVVSSAGTSFAANHQPAVTATVTPLATVNLGLSTGQAQNVQRWLAKYWGYTGGIDGQLGTNSWKAFQRNLQTYWGYTGAIDGVVGSGTVSALQRLLQNWGYTGAIDGIAGSGTQAAFKNFANGICAGGC